ncbi:MAG TPA: hypothetical protein VMW38_09400 [Terriglobia bacterium]|nr:hypothetical protein [Terriglobia bacterium]
MAIDGGNLTNKAALRIGGIGCTAWALWSLLIYAAKPGSPEGFGKSIFLISMLFVAGACVWACWELFPQHKSELWRRPANVLLSALAFLGILGVGHILGKFIAQGA